MTVLLYYLTFHVCASIWLSIKMLASLIHAAEILLHPAALTKKPILVKQSGEMLYIMLLSRRHTIHISILKDSRVQKELCIIDSELYLSICLPPL